MSVLTQYLARVRQILLHPVLFFRELPLEGGISGPLSFALVTHWLGAAFGYLWHSILGGATKTTFKSLLEQYGGQFGSYSDIDHPGRNLQWDQIGERLSNWFFGVAAVITDPFITLVTILVTSFLVFIGARILVSPGKEGHPNEISYESALRVIAFGMTPAILSGIPVMGGGFAWFYTWVVTVIGAREVYRVTTGKALVISLFPKLLFLSIVAGGIMLLAWFVFQFLAVGF